MDQTDAKNLFPIHHRHHSHHSKRCDVKRSSTLDDCRPSSSPIPERSSSLINNKSNDSECTKSIELSDPIDIPLTNSGRMMINRECSKYDADETDDDETDDDTDDDDDDDDDEGDDDDEDDVDVDVGDDGNLSLELLIKSNRENQISSAREKSIPNITRMSAGSNQSTKSAALPALRPSQLVQNRLVHGSNAFFVSFYSFCILFFLYLIITIIIIINTLLSF